jgi:hypothetical protein
MNPTIGRMDRVDAFTANYANITPYNNAANNPVKFIDINGDSVDVFAPDGTHLYTYNDGKKVNTGYFFQKSKTDKKGNISYSEGISFEYNDENDDRKSALEGTMSFSLVTDSEINNIVDKGISKVKQYSSKLHGTISEGMDGGSIDYNAGSTYMVPGNTLYITRSKTGGSRAYNFADFGNYLTGQSLNKLGYSVGWLKLFGHGNNIVNGARDHRSRKVSGFLDSDGDQRALLNGYGHFVNINQSFSEIYRLNPYH